MAVYETPFLALGDKGFMRARSVLSAVIPPGLLRPCLELLAAQLFSLQPFLSSCVHRN